VIDAAATAGPEADLPKRCDAVRNRERVIAAAATVFARDGLDAPVPEIARLAGVGKGTVYRNFPTKEHLAAAVAISRLQQLEQRAATVLATVDGPAERLRMLVLAVLEQLSHDRAVGEAVDVVADHPEVLEVQRRVSALLDDALAGAIDAGAVRDDVDGGDVKVLLTAVARALPPLSDGGWPGLWERYALLVLDALRPGGSPLPAGFADPDEARVATRRARGRG